MNVENKGKQDLMIFSKTKPKAQQKTTKGRSSRPSQVTKSKTTRSPSMTGPSTSTTKGTKKMTKPKKSTFKPTAMKPAVPSFNANRFSGPSSHSSSDTRKLTVGKDISLSGEIATCDHLVVEGTVEATVKGGQTLEITETGLFKGTVEIEDATIAGRFEGNLVVKGHLTLRSTGSVSGKVHYGDLAVEAGASINGTIKCVGLPVVEKSTDQGQTDSTPTFKAKTSVINDDEMLYEETPYANSMSANML